MATSSMNFPAVLQRIALKMTSSLNRQEVLSTITFGLVEQLDAALARIWLTGPGDMCGTCHKAAACSDRSECLHLVASAGLSSNLDGQYRRIPLGAFKIGWIAQHQEPVCTNNLLEDSRIQNVSWARENDLRTFAGYPLIFRGALLGVMGMFSRQPLDRRELELLSLFANQAAIAIKNAQLFTEVKALKSRLEAENLYLQEEIKLHHNFTEIVGGSSQIKTVLHIVEQVAPTDVTVLIQGETGTGKELIARAIHNLSGRKDQPLVRVSCGAIPEGLIESELFGHERGAFTSALRQRIGRFELADGGTIFLDEVGELPLDLQVKLLRVLQEREFERVGSSHPIRVDLRVIAATNRNLAEHVNKGSFRSDLFYRLSVFPIELPPLRERKSDIPDLVEYFLAKYSKRLSKPIERISRDVLNRLKQYSWPGNIRELESVIERAVILARGARLSIEDTRGMGLGNGLIAQAPRSLDEVDREHILRILKDTNWRIEGKRGAARILGLHPSTLRSRMSKLGIARAHGPS
jgi:transcriptional regulator with GAF, ATPase, and Fis domain